MVVAFEDSWRLTFLGWGNASALEILESSEGRNSGWSRGVLEKKLISDGKFSARKTYKFGNIKL